MRRLKKVSKLARSSLCFLSIYLLVTLAAGILLFSPVARAAPLDIILLDYPDIFSNYIDVTYDAYEDQFLATGFALTFNDDGSPSKDISNGTFDITAEIDSSGNLVSGSLTITGDVLTYSGTLLTGDLTEVGFYEAGNDPMEFLFDVTGGLLAIPDYYGNPGDRTGGVILALNSDIFSESRFKGSWEIDFDNNDGVTGMGLGGSDTGIVPIPSAVWLLASGLIAFVGIRRRL